MGVMRDVQRVRLSCNLQTEPRWMWLCRLQQHANCLLLLI